MASSLLPAISQHTEPAPPLKNGDRLSRAEFERRYQAMPANCWAELIEGEVHMPSPVRVKHHGAPHLDLMAFLGVYSHFTPGVNGAGNATVRLDMENEPQPDGLLYIEPDCGGRIRIDEDDFINGAPELAAEVSASTIAADLGKKFRAYRRNQVQEYIVWRVMDKVLDWFTWQSGNYQRLDATPEGVIKSLVFPGLWLDVPAILRGDFPQAHATLQQGLNSPEHADFVARLQKNKPANG